VPFDTTSQRLAEQRGVAHLARLALDGPGRGDLSAEALRLVHDVLGVDPADVIVVLDDRRLLVRTPAAVRLDVESADFVAALVDVTEVASERADADDAARRLALTDPLTGLPNRVLFADRLDHALTRARRDGTQVAVLLLDVDQFKLVNDSLGHDAGDELLTAIAPRLLAAVRESDTVARLAADEFAVLCEGIQEDTDAIALGERIGASLREPVPVQGRQLFVTASTGVVVSNDGAETTPELLSHADAAMYRAKEAGRGRVVLYDELTRGGWVDRLRMETDLRLALERGELSLVYQPIVDLRDGRTRCVEALLRWNHPERGPIGPDVFIPVAEETGLIVEIGRWVLETAVAQVAEWQRTQPGARGLGVTVNVSGRQLFHESLVGDVERVAAESGIAPGTLGLEITESVLMDEGDAATVLEALRARGARLSLDDFGTGYSSLSYLKRFPLDTLKIDRSFVSGLGTGQDDTALVATIVSMAGSLGLEVVAEGVETEEQLRRLRELGCDRAQGFLLARPLPPADLHADGVIWGASLLPARASHLL
jgi:diguanylate cyclase (GGDEF)-like protein